MDLVGVRGELAGQPAGKPTRALNDFVVRGEPPIGAEFKNGVLMLTLSKREKAKPEQVEVKIK